MELENLIIVFIFGAVPVIIHGKPVVSIQGAGASFPNEIYITWMAAYKALRSQFVKVDMTYDPRGSGYGQRSMMGLESEVVHYAGSDSVLPEEAYRDHPDLQMFPSMAG